PSVLIPDRKSKLMRPCPHLLRVSARTPVPRVPLRQFRARERVLTILHYGQQIVPRRRFPAPLSNFGIAPPRGSPRPGPISRQNSAAAREIPRLPPHWQR